VSSVRRLVLPLFLLLGAAPAHAATISVTPRHFSPANGSLSLSASVEEPAHFGIELASRAGKHVGWVVAPDTRQLVSTSWNGRLNGRAVPDGLYLVRLVAGTETLARTPIRIDSEAPRITDIFSSSGAVPFAGDNDLLTTISPNGDGFRDAAHIRLTLDSPATVTMRIARTVQAPTAPIYTFTQDLPAGSNVVTWAPDASVPARTYVVQLHVSDQAGNGADYGPVNAFVGKTPRTPVIRVQSVDAAFAQLSYTGGQLANLNVSTDAPQLSVQIYRSGPEHVETGADNVMNGVPLGEPFTETLSLRRDRPSRIRVGIGPWRSGLYFAKLTAPDGRFGYAPFVVRPPKFGEHRVAVVLPTWTWQAYNFWDATGDGFGDTWYTGGPHRSVTLGRPFLRRGVIPFFRRYDLGFLHWLAWRDLPVDYLADSDFNFISDGPALANAYDLVIFPGHTEYVNEHLFDVIEGYRNAGGNLWFLSANNFFWRIRQANGRLTKAAQFRQLGRPEASVIGIQYFANDEGVKQAPYVVRDPQLAPWLWDRTGLEQGGTWGETLGGYGIELDARAESSPPELQVVAEVPDVFGPGRTAQMAFYELPNGAKVFAAGTLDFGGSATFWPVPRMLDNLWARYSVP
jgi:hypothetical protein